jgi:hypothetical protein
MNTPLASWQLGAILSAAFTALTAIFAKIDVANINADFATLIRTLVILPVLAVIVLGTASGSRLGGGSAPRRRTGDIRARASSRTLPQSLASHRSSLDSPLERSRFEPSVRRCHVKQPQRAINLEIDAVKAKRIPTRVQPYLVAKTRT